MIESTSTISSQPTPPLLSLPSRKSSFLTIVKAQVAVLLSTLSDSTYAKSVAEINSLIEDNGKAVYLDFIRRLVQASQNHSTQSTPVSRLLTEQLHILAQSQASSSIFCDAVSLTDDNKVLHNFGFDFEAFIRDTSLSILEKTRLAISLQQSSKQDLVAQSTRVISANTPQLKEQFANNPDSLKEFVKSLGSAHYQNWNGSNDAVTLLINSLYNNNIPSDIETLIQDTRTMADGYARIAKVMQAHGPSDLYNILASIQSSSSITESDVAHVLGVFINVAGSNGVDLNVWNVKSFANGVNSAFTSHNVSLDWVKVVFSLDYPEFQVTNPAAFERLVNVFRTATEEKLPFPLEALWAQWSNVSGQIALIRDALNPQSDIVAQEWQAATPILTKEHFAQSPSEVQAQAAELEQKYWNSLNLIETLISLMDSDPQESVKSVLDSGLKGYTELLFLGLVQLKTPWNHLQQGLVAKLLHVYLTGTGTIPTLVQTRLWQVNQSIFLPALLELYERDRTTLPRLLKIGQELKILKQMLEVKSYYFALDLAVIASIHELLSLEKWLNDHLTTGGDVFFRGCVDFLGGKLLNETRVESPIAKDIKVEVLSVFLRCMGSATLSPENANLFKEVQAACVQIDPRLATMVAAVEGPAAAAAATTETSFSDEIEKITNDYYMKIYRGDISIAEIVELLQTFKNSAVPREQDIYACMIHNLFDEYRFFSTYREKQLSITSDLFGALIQHQLVSYIPLGIALRYVLEALRSTPGSKMFNFGAQALSRFQSRLQEWPTYCSHLLQIPALQQVHPEIIQYIQNILPSAGEQSQELSGSSSDMSAPGSLSLTPATMEQPRQVMHAPTAPSPVVPSAPVFTSLNVDTLMVSRDDIEYEPPSELVQDKILFIVNNVSQNNLTSKLQEMKEVLRETAYKWFSNYIVVKRASIEPNYHILYLQFLDGLQSPSLYRHILHETYSNIKILINSEKTVQSSSDRTLLKNLGSWLGGMTLARNRPIKHKNLAFKELLIEGYDSNRLIVAIPFVCKVLEQCNKSKVFKPPNPWLIAIMRLLVELYQFADLKLHLKFEIEVLCNSLTLDLKDIEPTSILKDRPPQELVAHPASLTQDFERLSMGGYAPSARMPVQANMPAAGGAPMDLPLDIMSNLASFVTFNPPAFFNERPILKRLVHIAIDRAVREIVEPVVNRSVTIAGLSTREMIIKDFAMEPNEEKMKKASHVVVQNLAGSLALVTCKEPLRVSMANIMRQLFLQNGFTDQNMPEQPILMTVNDNLDLACSVIEKAAMEKAIPEIDESLATAFANRKNKRELTGQPYYDMATYQSSPYPANLPDVLRVKPPGLTMHQYRFYEEYARMPRQAPMPSAFENDRAARTPLNTKVDAGQGYPFHVNETGYDNTPVPQPGHQAMDRFAQIIGELEKVISLTPAASLASLPPNHEVKMLARMIPGLPAQSFSPDELALTFSQKVVQLLYKTEQTLARDVYVVLLEQLCEQSTKVAREVTEWLIYADDERKFNVPVTVALIKAGLVNLVDQDMQLAKLIEIGRQGVVDFTVKLIRECVLGEPACASRNEFMNSLNALNRVAQRGGKPVESIMALIEDIRRRIQVPREVAKDTIDNSLLREQLSYIFTEWIRVYQLPTSNDKAYGVFINSIQQQGVLKGEEISSLFFRVCTELSIDNYIKYKSTNPTAAYQGVDAFAKLIVTLVKHYSDSQGANHNAAKVTYLTTLLSIIVLVLAQAHEHRRTHFNQKPFLRLFSGLLTEMMNAYESTPAMYFPILTAFSNAFQTLQPLVFPGFTYGWLSLISHRAFMPKLLLAENGKGWASYQKLLVSLFKFLVPFLVGGEMRETTRTLYKGTLRVLLVLLHDFPEFLCDYHFSFCDVIPHSCIQLRNLILSAFPRNMRLPDPFTPNLKVDLLPEINQPPRVLSDYTSSLTPAFKRDVDMYLRTREQAPFLQNLRESLAPDANAVDIYSNGSKYNVGMINALVLYVGVHGIGQLHAKTAQGSSPIAHTASMDIFQQLLNELDPEGRYHFLSAIANQLRYPNSHTHYFSRVLLYLFYETSQEATKEQVTRVLLERLIVNRPHPWGLLITFIELIKNPRYAFWEHDFTHIDPDIEKLFESVSRSVGRGADK